MVRIYVRGIGYLDVFNYTSAQRLANDIESYKTKYIKYIELDLEGGERDVGRRYRVSIKTDDIIMIE